MKFKLSGKNLIVEDYTSDVSARTLGKLTDEEKTAITNDEVSASLISKMDENDDAKALLKMAELTKQASEAKEIYLKLFDSDDSKVRTYLGNNTAAHLDPSIKPLLATEMAVAGYDNVVRGKVPMLEFVKNVVEFGDAKTVWINTYLLVGELVKQRKLAVAELLNPKWIIEPGIWKDETHEGSNYKIKLKLFLASEDLSDYINDTDADLPKTLTEYVKNNGGYKGLVNKKSDVLMKELGAYSDDEAQRDEIEDTSNQISLNDWLMDERIGIKKNGKVDLKKFYALLADNAEIVQIIKDEYVPEAKRFSDLLNGAMIDKNAGLVDKAKVVEAVSKWLNKHRTTADNDAGYALKNLFVDLRKTSSSDWKSYLEKCSNAGYLSGSDKKYVLGRLADVFTDREDLRKLLSGVKIQKDAEDMKKEVATKLLKYFKAGN